MSSVFLKFLKKFNGEGGIRTHGTRQEFNGFQDRLLKPLGHPSKTQYILAGNQSVVKGRPSGSAQYWKKIYRGIRMKSKVADAVVVNTKKYRKI